MFEYGMGVEESSKQAVCWFSNSAEQNYAPGQSSLGGVYGDGLGVEQDAKQAIYWFRKAAERGNVDSQTILKMLGVDWKK